MIKVDVKKVNNEITNIHISGHSEYDEFGKDIVCASVSSIVITSVNAIIKLDNSIKFKQESGNVIINVIKHTKNTDILINNMLELLENLEKQSLSSMLTINLFSINIPPFGKVLYHIIIIIIFFV